MNKTYQLGLEINRIRDKVIQILLDDLADLTNKQINNMDIDEFALRQYAQLDLSKLFLGLISNKPEIFRQYLHWQATVFGRGKITPAQLHDHIELMRKSLKQYVSEELHSTLDDYLNYGLKALDSQPHPEASYLDHEYTDKERAATYLQYLLDKKQSEAINYIAGLQYNKIKSVKTVFSSIIIPVQYEIGRLWQIGEITVADEHYATETSKSVINNMRNAYPETPKKGDVIAVALGGEMHDMGIRVVSECLRLEGYNVYFLGINTPVKNIITFAQSYPVDAIAVSVTNSNYVWWTKNLVDEVKQKQKIDAKIIVGGLAFADAPQIWQQIGADGYGSNAAEAVRLMNNLIKTKKMASR